MVLIYLVLPCLPYRKPVFPALLSCESLYHRSPQGDQPCAGDDQSRVEAGSVGDRALRGACGRVLRSAGDLGSAGGQALGSAGIKPVTNIFVDKQYTGD